MAGFDHITSCLALRDEDISQACRSRAESRALLEQLASVAKPNQGAAKILSVIAAVASADWLEGDMRVEVGGDADESVIDVLSELAGGCSERVWPALSVRVGLAEFQRAVRVQPKFVLPLKLKHDRPTRLILAVTADQRFSSLPPPNIAVGDEPAPRPAKMPSPPPVPMMAKQRGSSRPR